MGLDQYLKADFYFSPTWDNTGEKAKAIAKLCEVDVEKPCVEVRITLAHWRNKTWLHDFLALACDAADDYLDYFLVDYSALIMLLESANKVLEGKSDFSEEFKNVCNREGDLEDLREVKDQVIQILSDYPDYDFIYTYSV
jgi:hypothetical protein